MMRFLLALFILSLSCGAGEIHVSAGSRAAPADGSMAAPFRTISGALQQASPGDTVTVHAGMYRESLRVPGGTPEKPFILRAAPGERAIISGAVPVTSWKEHRGEIRTALLDFRPDRLLVSSRSMPLAREPNEGWWTAGSVEDLALLDERNLKSLRIDPTGGQAYIWTGHGNTFFTVPVVSLDRDRGRLAVERRSKWMRLSAGDRYYLENKPGMIDVPGEWAVREDGGGKFRLFFLPRSPGDLATVEAPRESRRVILVSRVQNVHLEGLEVSGSAKNGIEVSRAENVVISGCLVHNNGSGGIAIRDVKNITVRRSICRHNQSGLTLHTTAGAVIEENDIGHNRVDGLIVSWNSRDITARGNYIHHHLLWGHPDNLQLYRGVKNFRFIDNLLLAGGQSIMMEETSGGLLRGNMIVGCGAYSVILGHGNAEDYRIHNNTIAFSGYGCFNFTGRDYDVRENVLVTGHGGRLYGVRGIKGYRADRNLFFQAPGLPGKSILVSDRSWNHDLPGFQEATGQDRNSRQGDPLFRNAPFAFGVVDSRRLTDCTRELLYLRKGAGPFRAGDTVEVDFDGVARRVTAREGDRITISPGLPKKPIKGSLLCNWGGDVKGNGKGNLSLDLRLRENSPGAALSASGGPVGSRIDISAYRSGDFNGDGKRDLPPLPRELEE